MPKMTHARPYPDLKFSIVTPTFNSENTLVETIESVISQEGAFEIEYIIFDNLSTDSTAGIIKKYEKALSDGSYPIKCKNIDFRWSSERDRGMYDAINKGFSRSTGNVFAWINSDDIYLPGSFQLVARVFSEFPQVKWLKGVTSFIKDSSIIPGQCHLYDRDWIKKGYYGRGAYVIEQDSVFWRHELWKNAGGINPKLKLAGDYELWLKFSRIAELYALKADLSRFRIRKDQLSSNMTGYLDECRRISASPGATMEKFLMTFFIWEKRLLPMWMRPLVYRLLFGKPDFNLIEDNSGRLSIRKHGFYIA